MIIAEGQCSSSGDALWQLDDAGRLTISGTGSTNVYSSGIPWKDYIDKITCVTYLEGITDIIDDLCGMINVRRLELSNTVRSIFGRFENCSKLSEIIVTDTLTYITDYALEDTLWYKRQPKGQIYLGKVFYGCKGRSDDSSISIKEGTLGIARGAFGFTNDNIHIDIPSSVKCIAHSAHTFPDKCECMSIGKINWSLDSDGELFFGGDRGIMKDLKNADEQPWKNIRQNIRCAVKSYGIECRNIGKNIFAQCSSIEEVRLGDTVEVISAGAFKNCTSLRSVTGLGKVRLIEKGAFSGCTALTEFEVPKLMKGISGQALVRYNEENDIVFTTESPKASDGELLGGYGEDFTWKIESSGTMYFTGSGAMPFLEKFNCTDSSIDDEKVRRKVKKLIIDDRITEVNFEAFENFIDLKAVELPAALKRICTRAFYGCRSLTDIVIPNGTEYIDDSAFLGCSGIKSIVIPESVKKIGYGAFRMCWELTDITLPDSVILDSSVFSGSGLENNCAGDIFYLGDWVLGFKSTYEKNGDVVLRFKKGTKRIAPAAFGSYDYPLHDELVGVILDNDITYVGEHAFAVCENLREVTADCTFEKLGKAAFAFTQWSENRPSDQIIYLANAALGIIKKSGINLQELSDSHPVYRSIEIDREHGSREITLIADYAFYNIKTAEKVIIPDTIKYIGDFAFCLCEKLKEVKLPEGLERVGDEAFACCGFDNITIPASVIDIGKYAFGYRYTEDKSKYWTKERYVKLEGFVIRGEYGSAAHRYAIENEFEFEEIW